MTTLECMPMTTTLTHRAGILPGSDDEPATPMTPSWGDTGTALLEPTYGPHASPEAVYDDEDDDDDFFDDDDDDDGEDTFDEFDDFDEEDEQEDDDEDDDDL